MKNLLPLCKATFHRLDPARQRQGLGPQGSTFCSFHSLACRGIEDAGIPGRTPNPTRSTTGAIRWSALNPAEKRLAVAGFRWRRSHEDETGIVEIVHAWRSITRQERVPKRLRSPLLGGADDDDDFEEGRRRNPTFTLRESNRKGVVGSPRRCRR